MSDVLSDEELGRKLIDYRGTGKVGLFSEILASHRALKLERDLYLEGSAEWEAAFNETKGERDTLQEDLTAQENATEMHAGIVRDVAEALGQEFGETCHDLGEKVKALCGENSALRKRIEQAEGQRDKHFRQSRNLYAKRERALKRVEQLEGRRFPIQGGPSIPWRMILPHERQLLLNHGGQTLERIAERHGLSPSEALAVLDDEGWSRSKWGGFMCEGRGDHPKEEIAKDELERRRAAFEDDREALVAKVRYAEEFGLVLGIVKSSDCPEGRLGCDTPKEGSELWRLECGTADLIDAQAEVRKLKGERDEVRQYLRGEEAFADGPTIRRFIKWALAWRRLVNLTEKALGMDSEAVSPTSTVVVDHAQALCAALERTHQNWDDDREELEAELRARPPAPPSATTPEEMREIMAAVAHCDEIMGEDGLCGCARVVKGKLDSLRAGLRRLKETLDEAAEATGIAGVDEPMTLVECVKALRYLKERAEKRAQDCIDTDCPQLDALHARALQAEGQRDRLLADLRRAREALVKYGVHKAPCPFVTLLEEHKSDDYQCKCGLDEALKPRLGAGGQSR